MATGKKRIKKKPTLTQHSGAVRKPKSVPACPTHNLDMTFDALRNVWQCIIGDCKQIAFPAAQIDKGKPTLVRGALEVVLVKDPDGAKDPRILLRTLEGNIMLDVTDYVRELRLDSSTAGTLRHVEQRHEPLSAPSDVKVRLTFDMHNIVDTRS